MKLTGAWLAGVLTGVLGTVLAIPLTPITQTYWDRYIAFKYTITAPPQDQEVSASQGFRASGTVENLPLGESLWVLDRDSTGYFVAQKAVIKDGTWSAVSAPLGGPTEPLPFEQQFVIVRATGNCADKLTNANDGYLEDLAEGCTILETRFVHAVRP